MAKAVVSIILLLLFLLEKGQSRPLGFNYTSDLVSDGVDHVNQPSFIQFKGLQSSEECEHMYGFLPCADNLAGQLFQIVVYEYLLFLGEKYVSAGSELMFKILGPGIFGASVFHILGSLPEALMVLVSGLSYSPEIAQEKVLTGVGLLAGSTVLLLTVVWGTCVIVGRRDLQEGSTSKDSPLSFLSGSGITTDLETSYTARIMIISVVPFIIVQLPEIFQLSYGRRFTMLISIIVSVAFLLLYFLYQIFEPWIQKRRLYYVKHEHLMVGFLKHVQRHASRKLLTDDGKPNLQAIRRLFEKIDIDADNSISSSDLNELIMETNSVILNSDKNHSITEIMKDFDLDNDNKISKEEFVNGFVRWLVKKKHAFDSQGSPSKKALDELYQGRMIEYARSKYLIQEIIRHVQNDAIGSLLTNDGEPNIPNIRRLFEKFDLDGDNCISVSELNELIKSVKFTKINLDKEKIVEQIMKELDSDGDQKITQMEFLEGLPNLIHSERSEDDLYLKDWKETDMLLDDKSKEGMIDSPLWTCTKSILLLLLGTTILSLLAEPLIETVQDFSESANLPSFFVSFIFVPLATNSREAVEAITSASHGKDRTTSLTFSEIYGGVFMNNMLGLSILLSLVYIRGLSWDFSAEVLIIFIICAIMGLLTSFRSKFPLWTSFVAYLLYPLSLLLVYVLNYFFNWS